MKGLEETIRAILHYAPDMLAQFEAGKYDIIDEAGSVIFPGGWNAIVGPGIRITMRIWPSRQYAIEPYQVPELDPIMSLRETLEQNSANIARERLLSIRSDLEALVSDLEGRLRDDKAS